MRLLTYEDMEKMSLGSAVLGSGGGGDSTYVLMMIKYLMEKNGPIRLIDVSELKDDDLVVPLSFMGAPLISAERLVSGTELETILATIQSRLSLTPTVLMPAEIGGANAFTPFLLAAKTGLPVLDADMIGRAFPELQMSSCYLKKLAPTPAVMADCLGNKVVIETGDANMLETVARSVTVVWGSSCAVAFYLMRGNQVADAVVRGTVSQAMELGGFLAKRSGPIGKEVCRGTLIDIEQSLSDGFLKGSFIISNDEKRIKVRFQNEYLLVEDEEKRIAATPDILLLLDENSGAPITSETLRYGLQVVLMVILAPSIWKTPEGLALVGPEVFYKEEMPCTL